MIIWVKEALTIGNAYKGNLKIVIICISFNHRFLAKLNIYKIFSQETFASRTGDPDKGPSLFQRLLSGGIAGVLGQTASYPLDIIR